MFLFSGCDDHQNSSDGAVSKFIKYSSKYSTHIIVSFSSLKTITPFEYLKFELHISMQELADDVITGAMTYSFFKSIEIGYGSTYGCLLNSMRTVIKDIDNPKSAGHLPRLFGKLKQRLLRSKYKQVISFLSSFNINFQS